MDMSIVECIKSVNESGVKRGDKLIVISHSVNMKTNLYRGQLMDSRRIITIDKCYFSSPPVTKKHPSFNLDRTKLQTMETSSDGYEQPNKNGSMRIPRPAIDPPTVLRQTPHPSVRLIQPPASRAPPPVPPRSSSRIATTAPNYNIRI
uniref:Uncharacterized protein n=1 Tax=Acrobeloides nanus TaxID=290746 RepID=A0A914CNA3_9BILA